MRHPIQSTTMLMLLAVLIFVPIAFGIAYAYDNQWTNNFEGIAGGSGDAGYSDAVCSTAHLRAYEKAKANNCTDYTGSSKHGVQIGQSERCDCQCADGVCVCVDKLDIVCLMRDVK